MFELLGPTLDTVVSDYYTGGETLAPDTIIRLSEQLLQAIAFLHEVGYIHGGMPLYMTPPDVYAISPEERNLHYVELTSYRY